MPAYPRPDTATETVSLWTPGFSIQMRSEVDFGTYGRIVKAVYHRGVERDDNREWYAAFLEEGAVALIESWNLEDEQGHPLPITVETINGLRREDGNLILEAASKRLQPRSPEEEAPFGSASSRSSTATTSNRRPSSRSSRRSGSSVKKTLH